MKNLIAAVIADKAIDATEVSEIKALIYKDGKIDLEEIKGLFEMKDAVEVADESFIPMMVQAVIDWAFADGVLDNEEGTALLELISGDGVLDVVEIEILDTIKGKVIECPSLLEFMAFQDLVVKILEDGVIDAEEVTTIKAHIYNDGIVDSNELVMLFYLKDNATNACPEFAVLIAQAVCDYALVPEGVVDEVEGALIVNLIEGDGVLDIVEIEILNRINAEAVSIESEPMKALIAKHIAAE